MLNKDPKCTQKNSEQYERRQINRNYFDQEIQNSLEQLRHNKKIRIKEQWTGQQDQVLFQNFCQFGSKWGYIANLIQKTPNAVKNRFYGKLRKLQRRLNFIGQKHTSKKKPITFNALMRPLQAQFSISPYITCTQDKQMIRQKTILYAKKQPLNIDINEAQQLIDRVHKFNYYTRSFRFVKGEVKQIKGKNNEKSLNTCLTLQIQPSLSYEQNNENSPNISIPSRDFKLMDEQMIEELYNKYKKQDGQSLEHYCNLIGNV